MSLKNWAEAKSFGRRMNALLILFAYLFVSKLSLNVIHNIADCYGSVKVCVADRYVFPMS
jgi:hypothetical protein